MACGAAHVPEKPRSALRLPRTSRLAEHRQLLPAAVVVVFAGKVLRLSDRLGNQEPDKSIK